MEASDMSLMDELENLTHLFLDTSPLIYYVERNPLYFSIVKPIFDYIDNGTITAVTSPITLAECLVGVYRLGLIQSQKDFFDLIVYGNNIVFIPIDHDQAQKAGQIRAKYNLTLTDAFQFATALLTGCEVFLTNDITLKRVTEIHVLVLDDMRINSMNVERS